MDRSKKGITFDLKSPKGEKIFKDLVKKIDVVEGNFSPGTMEKLGLGYEEVLKSLNPHLIYANISGTSRGPLLE
jgi:CoA:oxalate CoA-transferase